jgi:molecular chaperone GrpE
MSDRPDSTPTADTPTDPPAEAPSASPEVRIAELEAALAAAREEARTAHDRWVRERADLENLRKRGARERQDAVRFGNESIVRELLPVVDNLERALKAAATSGEARALVDGVDLILKALLDALARHGVERVTAHGAPFDPTHHEAVAHVESAHEPNLVIEEHQPGYRLHDRLLRPALVTVSKGQERS